MKEGIEIKKPPILFRKTQDIINSVAKLSKVNFLSYWV